MMMMTTMMMIFNYLTTLFRYIGHGVPNGRMTANDELEGVLKEAVVV
jgi:hypothetical protein